MRRYGAPSVYGRVMTAGEILRMEFAENFYKDCNAYFSAEDQADWAVENFAKFELILEAQEIADNGR